MDFSSFNSFDGALSGASSLIGFADSIAGFFGQSSSQRYNREMAREQMRFQAEQARLQREWQSNEAKLSRDFSLDMWNKNNAYNSPDAMYQRLSDAGLNPFSAFNQNAYQSVASQPQSAMASGGASANGVMPPYVGDSTLQFSQLSQAFDFLAKAEKTGLDTKFLRETFQLSIDTMSVDLELKNLAKDIQTITRNNLPHRVQLELQKLGEEINLMIQQGDINSYKIQETIANIDLLYERAGLTKTQRDLVKKVLDNFDERFTAEMERIYSEVVKNYALTDEAYSSSARNYAQAQEAKSHSAYLDAQTETENLVRKDKAKILEYDALTRELSYSIDKKNSRIKQKSEWFQYYGKLHQAGIITKKMMNELKILEAKSKYAEVNELLNSIQKGVDIVRSGADAANSIMDVVNPTRRFLAPSPPPPMPTPWVGYIPSP